jgi:hypothetical protein
MWDKTAFLSDDTNNDETRLDGVDRSINQETGKRKTILLAGLEK